eukprot:TRINITY_DN29490_c0_g1_i1.p2 TRINITY_DN29490_c0_g1~~TRINITY_DN29490_c0_g1_i1.p2  ORF type:complete len:130 (+),score=25.35 TRINITY_DN29490_c0_g1_i1:443-832(+)
MTTSPLPMGSMRRRRGAVLKMRDDGVAQADTEVAAQKAASAPVDPLCLYFASTVAATMPPSLTLPNEKLTRGHADAAAALAVDAGEVATTDANINNDPPPCCRRERKRPRVVAAKQSLLKRILPSANMA